MFSSPAFLPPARQTALDFSGVFIRVGVATAGYYLMARLGLAYGTMGGVISPVWPPAGVAVALVWWLGPWVLPGVFLGAWLANMQGAPGPFFQSVLLRRLRRGRG